MIQTVRITSDILRYYLGLFQEGYISSAALRLHLLLTHHKSRISLLRGNERLFIVLLNFVQCPLAKVIDRNMSVY